MGLKLIKIALMLFLSLPLVAQKCQEQSPPGPQGTETGNPPKTGNPASAPASSGEDSNEKTYANTPFGVKVSFDKGWSSQDREAPKVTEPFFTGDQPIPSITGGIDTSKAPSAEFTDGSTKVIIYFVALETPPSNLLQYLNQVFAGRSFEPFTNTQGLKGFKYDNPEQGPDGSDRQEYYFLKGGILLYLVVDLSSANNGTEKFLTLIQSLRFE